MVQLTIHRLARMKTFGYHIRSRDPKYNHRVPIKYQRFQDEIDKEEIVSHYSRDDIDKIDPREGERTYKDALHSLGRKNYLLPNLSAQDLELNHLYQEELDRQRAIVARVSKIRVLVDSLPGKGAEMMMNKDISTPYDCARHIHDLVANRSVVAELDEIDPPGSGVADTQQEKPQQEDTTLVSQSQEKDEGQLVEVKKRQPSVYWDMHRPLQDSCRIKFRHFAEKDVAEVNKIYWRSCSFVLGMAIRLAFKDGIKVLPHSWPKPDIKSGSFVYDVALNLNQEWKPTEQELRAFTKVMWNIKSAALPFDRLQVEREVALRLFSKNPFKSAQVDSILENKSSRGKITVYRCGGLLDISIGPMISNTSQIGRITLAAVHPIDSAENEHKGIFYRFQGVSLPQELPLSSYLYQNIIIEHAKKLNKIAL